MNTFRFYSLQLMVPFIALIINQYIAIAQLITTSPKVDSLCITGGCVLASANFRLIKSSLGIDTVVVYSPEITPKLFFIIQDSTNQFHYELWLRPTNIDQDRLLVFDSLYFINSQLYWLVLRVYSDTILVDSLGIKFRAVEYGLSVKDYVSLPKCISLEQNYPNPFNPFALFYRS